MTKTWWQLTLTGILVLYFVMLCLTPSSLDIVRVGICIVLGIGLWTHNVGAVIFHDSVLLCIVSLGVFALLGSAFNAGDLSKPLKIFTWILPFILGKIYCRANQKHVLNMLLWGSISLAFYALLAFISAYLSQHGILHLFSLQDMSLTFRNATRTALFAATACMICIYSFFSFKSKNNYLRNITAFSIAIFLTALILLGKRMTFAALIGTSAAFLLLHRKAVPILAIGLTSIVGISILGQHQRFDLSPNHLFASQGYIERETVWYAARELFASHPILGTGYGTFKEKSKPFVEEYRKLSSSTTPYENLEDAHNILIHFAAESGSIGVLLLLAIFLLPLRNAWKYRAEHPAVLCLGSCILLTFLHLQLHAHLSSANVSGLIFLLIGMTQGLCQQDAPCSPST